LQREFLLTLHIVPKRARLRAAVVGTGVFGRHHGAKYQQIQGVELVATADPSPVARMAAKAQLGVPAVSDWRALRGEVDLVSICSPASTHGPIVRGFLEAGAHVLVEKPIATDVREAEDLILLAQRCGRVLTVGHQERFVFAKSGLLNGSAPPVSIECVRAGPWTGRSTDVGVVLDLMIHDLDLVHSLIPGEPGEIRALGRRVRGVLADEAEATLTFPEGRQVRLFASRIADLRRRTMRLTYPDGIIEIDFLTRSMRNTTACVLPPLDMEDPLGDSVSAFVASVAGGPDTLVRPEEARRALETALLIEEAAFTTGAPVAEGVALIA
jgi:predicted dehydrogenase